MSVLRGESSLDKGPNTLLPALLTALAATTKAFQSYEPVYDSLTPIHVWIRAYVTEPSRTVLFGQMLEKKIADAILLTTENDTKIILQRKVRKAVNICEIWQRKIRLFKKINRNFFETFFNGYSLMISVDRIKSFGAINKKITDALTNAFKKLKILNDAQNNLMNRIDQINAQSVVYKKYLHAKKKNKKAMQQLCLKIFPERKIVSTEAFTFSSVF